MEVGNNDVGKHLKNFEIYNTSAFGPDCIISSSNEPNLDVLNKVDYYWFVSQSNGCVECIVNKTGQKPKTTNPNCVITRKHRRIEAYCCMVCKSSFITVTQALIHFKTMHRPNKKIFIQNQDMQQEVQTSPIIMGKSSLQLRKTHSASVLRNCNDVHTTEPEPSTNVSPELNLNAAKVKVETEISVETEEKKSSQVNSPQRAVDCSELPIETSQACLAVSDAFNAKQHLVSALKFSGDNSTVTALQADQSSVTALSPQTKRSNHRASFEHQDAQTLNFDLIKLECSDERRKDDVEYKLISNDAQLACNLLISLAGKTVSVSDSRERSCVEKASKISTNPQSKAQEKSANFILGSSDSSDEESSFRPPNTFNYPPPRKKKCLHPSYSTPNLKSRIEKTELASEDSESVTRKDSPPPVESAAKSSSEDQQKKHVTKKTPSASNSDVTIPDSCEHSDVTKAPLLSSVSFPLLQSSSPATSSSKPSSEPSQQLYRVQILSYNCYYSCAHSVLNSTQNVKRNASDENSLGEERKHVVGQRKFRVRLPICHGSSLHRARLHLRREDRDDEAAERLRHRVRCQAPARIAIVQSASSYKRHQQRSRQLDRESRQRRTRHVIRNDITIPADNGQSEQDDTSAGHGQHGPAQIAQSASRKSEQQRFVV